MYTLIYLFVRLFVCLYILKYRKSLTLISGDIAACYVGNIGNLQPSRVPQVPWSTDPRFSNTLLAFIIVTSFRQPIINGECGALAQNSTMEVIKTNMAFDKARQFALLTYSSLVMIAVKLDVTKALSKRTHK